MNFNEDEGTMYSATEGDVVLSEFNEPAPYVPDTFENRGTIKIMSTVEGYVPSYSHNHDAGADLRTTATRVLYPSEVYPFPTGVRMEVPPGYVGLVCPRSGLALAGVGIANAPGVVDAGYQGEIKVLLHNMSATPKTIVNGERIAQIVLVPILKATFELVDSFDTVSERGEGGFGSTGK